MAVVVTTLTSGADLAPAGVTSTTASISPTADRSIFVIVLCTRAAGAIASPTLSGNGITWGSALTSVTYNTTGTPLSRLSIFRGSSGTPTTGVITFTHSATPTEVVWWVVDDANAPATASAATQTATGSGNAGTTSLATLAAFQRTANGALAATAVVTGITPTAGSGWTDLGTQSTRLQLEWRADNDTTADATFVASNWAMVAVELAAAFSLEPISVDDVWPSINIPHQVEPTYLDDPWPSIAIPHQIEYFSVPDIYSDLTVNSTAITGVFSSSVNINSTFTAVVVSDVTGTFTSVVTVTSTFTANLDITGTFSSAVTVTSSFNSAVDQTGSFFSPITITSTFVGTFLLVGNFDSTVRVDTLVQPTVDSPFVSNGRAFTRLFNLGPRVQAPPGSRTKTNTGS